jgi:hypothetical protein
LFAGVEEHWEVVARHCSTIPARTKTIQDEFTNCGLEFYPKRNTFCMRTVIAAAVFN